MAEKAIAIGPRTHASTMEAGRFVRIMLPMLCVAAMLALGFWLRWPNMRSPGFTRQQDYNDYAFKNFSYSDIPSLYYRDQLWEQPRPYFDYQLEYPVGMGALIYVVNSSFRQMRPYYLATSALLAVCGLFTAWLIPRFPYGRIWLLALSPALAFYVNLNWDMAAVLLTVGALLLFIRERDSWGAAVLAAAVWTKFFPIVILPLIIVERLRDRKHKAVARIVAVFALVSALINSPVLILAPRGWLYFFEVSRTRPVEINLWTFFKPWDLPIATVNLLSSALLFAGIALLAWAVWRGPHRAFLPASCAALAWFFFVNKVYSPQYSLWIVVLLAVIGAAPALAILWSGADLLYFAASFLILGVTRFEGAADWFRVYGLMPAMAIREAALLLVTGYCVWYMLAFTEMSRHGDTESQKNAR